jgi:hypothetical protein
MKWTDQQLFEEFEKHCENVNGKLRFTSSQVNKVILDPRCPDPQHSNIAEYLIRIQKKSERQNRYYHG